MLIRFLLTPEQRAAIGDVVSESARLEAFLEFMICALAKFDANAQGVFLRGMMIDRKLEVLKALGEPKLKSRNAEPSSPRSLVEANR